MSDLISRQDAIDLLEKWSGGYDYIETEAESAIEEFCDLPSAQPEQTKIIKEIRKWINSGNRGSADYFIVDKIEEIINKYE